MIKEVPKPTNGEIKRTKLFIPPGHLGRENRIHGVSDSSVVDLRLRISSMLQIRCLVRKAMEDASPRNLDCIKHT